MGYHSKSVQATEDANLITMKGLLRRAASGAAKMNPRDSKPNRVQTQRTMRASVFKREITPNESAQTSERGDLLVGKVLNQRIDNAGKPGAIRAQWCDVLELNT
jgi:hypothetical protein